MILSFAYDIFHVCAQVELETQIDKPYLVLVVRKLTTPISSIVISPTGEKGNKVPIFDDTARLDYPASLWTQIASSATHSTRKSSVSMPDFLCKLQWPP